MTSLNSFSHLINVSHIQHIKKGSPPPMKNGEIAPMEQAAGTPRVKHRHERAPLIALLICLCFMVADR
ncbi:MAG: hypothetical protein ABI373_03350, partial [Flavobacteriales bacterium]